MIRTQIYLFNKVFYNAKPFSNSRKFNSRFKLFEIKIKIIHDSKKINKHVIDICIVTTGDEIEFPVWLHNVLILTSLLSHDK